MPQFIPSPDVSRWTIGPVTVHFYALCLLTGIITAWLIGLRRWQGRGGTAESFENIMLWAIPGGIVGARAYHVSTHLGDYFGPGIDPLSFLYIWQGGIAIFGAISGGAIAAWFACRHYGANFVTLADVLAPGIAVGQAMGRFGNWFNQELYGLPTTLPWGLEIDLAHRPPGLEQFATFHPTFLYESVWNVAVAGILLAADRRWRLGRGKLFVLYLGLYSFGRIFTESLRLDPSYLLWGTIRFNQFIAMALCLVAAIGFVVLLKIKPGPDESALRPARKGHLQ